MPKTFLEARPGLSWLGVLKRLKPRPPHLVLRVFSFMSGFLALGYGLAGFVGAIALQQDWWLFIPAAVLAYCGAWLVSWTWGIFLNVNEDDLRLRSLLKRTGTDPSKD